MVKSSTDRYYCKHAESPGGHCDSFRGTVQCSECIVKEQELVKENPYQHYYGWNRPID